MSLTAEQLRARAGKLTASRVRVLMDGSDQDLYDLWRELTGDPTCQPPDLSGVWAVRLGEATEDLNLDWYEYKTGRRLTRKGEVVTSRERAWAAATLDGFDEDHPGGPAVIEAKHVNGFAPFDSVAARYLPQVHWQMYVTRTRLADLLWQCVETLTPPVALPPAEPPKPATREIDMTDNTDWASPAAAWLEHRPAAMVFRSAERAIKELVPAAASRVHGHGITVKRSRNGALRIGAIK